MRLVLDWPSPNLSPNQRVHWSRMASALKRSKRDTWAIASRELREQGLLNWAQSLARNDTSIAVRLIFHPPDRRKRDLDNLLASHKAALDGIAQALCVDDHRFIPTLEWGEVRRPACVIIELMEM